MVKQLFSPAQAVDRLAATERARWSSFFLALSVYAIFSPNGEAREFFSLANYLSWAFWVVGPKMLAGAIVLALHKSNNVRESVPHEDFHQTQSIIIGSAMNVLPFEGALKKRWKFLRGRGGTSFKKFPHRIPIALHRRSPYKKLIKKIAPSPPTPWQNGKKVIQYRR